MDRQKSSAEDLESVAQARIEAQNAAQWLARFAQSYTVGAPQGQDALLQWNATAQRFTTPEVAPGVALELSLPTLVLQFVEHGKPSPHAIDIEGKSSSEVEAWMLIELLHRGFDRDHFSKRLPYNWTRLMTGDEVKYSPEAHVKELRLLTDWFEAATGVLGRVKQAVTVPDKGNGGGAGLLCWPDRLDIGFRVPTSGETGGVIEVGFTVGRDDAIRPGYFVRQDAKPAGRTLGDDIVLSLAEVTERSMSSDDVTAHLIAATKAAKMPSAN